jgi:hypothetical protein
MKIMSSGSVSSLVTGEANGSHIQDDEEINPTPLDTAQTPENLVMMSPQIYRSSTGSSGKLKDSVRKMFTRSHTTSDDGMENGDSTGGQRKKLTMLNRFKTNNHQRFNYRLHIPGRRHRHSNIAVSVDEYDNGCNSDPEGFLNDFDGSDEDPDSGEGAIPYQMARRRDIEDLEQKIREIDDQIACKLDDTKGKSKDVDIHSPDSDEKPSNKSWKRPLAKKRSPSVDQLRKKRDGYSSQLEALKTPTSSQNRFMGNTRMYLGSGFRHIQHSLGLKMLKPRFKRPKSADGEDVIRTKSASLEDVHPSSDIFATVEEGEDVEELREEMISLQADLDQRSKDLEDHVVKNETALDSLQRQVSELMTSLNSEKQRTAQLEVSFMEVMELKQHEVDNLQEQLTNIEKQSLERQQFLEEQLDEYQAKVEKMEVDLHTRLTQDQLTPTNVSSPFGRRLIMGCISSLLFVVTTLLAVAGFIRDVLIWAKGKMQRHPMLVVVVVTLLLVPLITPYIYSASSSDRRTKEMM